MVGERDEFAQLGISEQLKWIFPALALVSRWGLVQKVQRQAGGRSTSTCTSREIPRERWWTMKGVAHWGAS